MSKSAIIKKAVAGEEAAYIVTPTMAPSMERYRSFTFTGKVSITRLLQYEALATAHIEGKVLDFGGGEKADYRALVSCDSYESVNINPDIEPTWLTNVGDSVPCPDSSFDTVITLNTLEHVFDTHFVLDELHRVLRSGGAFVCGVPFMHKVHGHPDDFFRATPSWWGRTLQQYGFTDIRIRPLLWGPISNGFQCSGKIGPFKKVRTRFAMLADIAYASFKCKDTGTLDPALQNYALAYFIEAVKA